jgi:transposase
MAGRKTKLTKNIQEIIITAIQRGLTLDAACGYARVGTSTLYEWLARGERDKKGVFREFADAVKMAQIELELNLLDSIIEIAKEDDTMQETIESFDGKGNLLKVRKVKRNNTSQKNQWQAKAWFLERRFPKRYGRQLMLENDDAPRPMAAFNVIEVPDEE